MKNTKVHWLARLLSLMFYLRLVSVESKLTGKRECDSRKRYCRKKNILSDFEQIVEKAIIWGDSISLVKSNLTLKASSFFELEIFKRNCQFIFWTFDQTFLDTLFEKLQSFETLKIEEIKSIFNQNSEAYKYSLYMLLPIIRTGKCCFSDRFVALSTKYFWPPFRAIKKYFSG